MLLSEMDKKGLPLKIGQWWTQCCERDMEKIENESDMDAVRNSFLPAMVWNSEKEGLLELMPDLDEVGDDDREYWLDLLENADGAGSTGPGAGNCPPGPGPLIKSV